MLLRHLVRDLGDCQKGRLRHLDDGVFLSDIEGCFIHSCFERRPLLCLLLAVGIKVGETVSVEAPALAQGPGEESSTVRAAFEHVERAEQGDRVQCFDFLDPG